MKKLISIICILSLTFMNAAVLAEDAVIAENTETAATETDIAEAPEPELPKEFEDIDGHWAENDIKIMRENGIITGRSETVFAPDEYVTRAEFAVLISRLCEYDTKYDRSVFHDVDINSWYGKAVNAAYLEGAIKGDSDGYFRPDGLISLEETATIVNRVYKSHHPEDKSAADMNILNGFKNLSETSVWAREEVAYAAGKGFIYRLYENGYFEGTRNATRAQVAAILHRLYNSVK